MTTDSANNLCMLHVASGGPNMGQPPTSRLYLVVATPPQPLSTGTTCTVYTGTTRTRWQGCT